MQKPYRLFCFVLFFTNFFFPFKLNPHFFAHDIINEGEKIWVKTLMNATNLWSGAKSLQWMLKARNTQCFTTITLQHALTGLLHRNISKPIVGLLWANNNDNIVLTDWLHKHLPGSVKCVSWLFPLFRCFTHINSNSDLTLTYHSLISYQIILWWIPQVSVYFIHSHTCNSLMDFTLISWFRHNDNSFVERPLL